MKFIKEFFCLFIDPIKVIGNKNFSEAASKFFLKHKYFIFILAFMFSVLVFLYFNKFDFLIKYFKK